METTKYSFELRVLHWLMSLLIFGMLPVGFYMSDLDDSLPLKSLLIHFHQSMGLVFLGLAVIRLFVKWRARGPELPSQIPLWEQKLAQLTHGLMYLVFFVMPVSGILMTNLSGYPVPFFFFELPNFFSKNEGLGKFFAETHEFLAWGVIGLTVLHIGGIAKVKVVNQLNLLRRML